MQQMWWVWPSLFPNSERHPLFVSRLCYTHKDLVYQWHRLLRFDEHSLTSFLCFWIQFPCMEWYTSGLVSILIYLVLLYYITYHTISYHMTKQSHYRPWEAPRFPGGWGSQILRQSAHEASKVVSPTHRPPLPPGNILVLISVRGWVDPRAIVDRKDYVNENIQWHDRDSKPRPTGL
jgi:hypothetical protein